MTLTAPHKIRFVRKSGFETHLLAEKKSHVLDRQLAWIRVKKPPWKTSSTELESHVIGKSGIWCLRAELQNVYTVSSSTGSSGLSRSGVYPVYPSLYYCHGFYAVNHGQKQTPKSWLLPAISCCTISLTTSGLVLLLDLWRPSFGSTVLPFYHKKNVKLFPSTLTYPSWISINPIKSPCFFGLNHQFPMFFPSWFRWPVGSTSPGWPGISDSTIIHSSTSNTSVIA